MEAIKSNIHAILDGKKQFLLPVYQRTYRWEWSQCERLWKDIVRMQKNGWKGHFIGAIVNIAEQAMPAGVQKFMLIDGQQRITTILLLLVALRDYLLKHPDQEVNPDEITETCLKNKFQAGEEQYKLILTQTDKDLLFRLIEQSPIDVTASSRILDNYYFFFHKIMQQELSPALIYQATGKLQIVNITLNREYDDPQLIFESLNSTGVDLSQSDLIRNYILMGLKREEQNQIYQTIWHLMEQLFDYEKKTSIMDRFFRDYLTMKLGQIPNMNQIYEEFKAFHELGDYQSTYAFCLELYQYAKYYTDFYYCRAKDKKLVWLFQDIKALQMEAAYPFLLKVYYDFENGTIEQTDFEEIIRLCESYVFRRSICEMPTNSLNKTFATMKYEIKESNYFTSVKAFFITRDSYKSFPTNDQFAAAFCSKDIYHMRIRNYILSKLENYENKAPINIENYTIEHIMPQNKNLSPEWKEMLGEEWRNIQHIYLHTIGNLTLTAYNSELSDHSFQEKMQMEGGFQQSALRLNQFVIDQTEWKEETIVRRATKLCEIAMKIWGYPKLSSEELKNYLPKETEKISYSIEDYPTKAATRQLLECLDKRIRNISADVKRDCNPVYITYKYDTDFVDVIIQQERLCLSLNLSFFEVDDPLHLCRDVSNTGRWGTGEIELFLEDIEQLDAVMQIVIQAYHKQSLESEC